MQFNTAARYFVRTVQRLVPTLTASYCVQHNDQAHYCQSDRPTAAIITAGGVGHSPVHILYADIPVRSVTCHTAEGCAYVNHRLSRRRETARRSQFIRILEVFLNDMRYINPRFTYLLYLLTCARRRSGGIERYRDLSVPA